MTRLGPNRYGKSAVRLVKVERNPDRHVLRDATVAIALEGEFDAAHRQGDNRGVLPTDTMKNTVYALAREHYTGAPEAFALRLARHFLEHPAALSRARVRLAEAIWTRIDKSGKPHPSAFLRAGTESRLARIDAGHASTVIHGGIDDLVILKTSGSAFEDFIRDEFTTLPDTSDRIFATALRAVWLYNSETADFDTCWQWARSAILQTFANHDSKSVQHTLYAMGEAVLEACAEIAEIRFVMPNRHHIPIDMTRLGLENQNDIFVATREPFGRIEAVVKRD